MKNITKVLSDEHQIILKVIQNVLNECKEMEDGKSLDPEYFRKVIDFIQNYADRFHHAKEEEVLFKAMLENIGNLHCNPIPVMVHEHDEGRNYVRGMEESLSEKDNDKLIGYARSYCYLLQDHIYKEDNILYPMAENALSDAEKEFVLVRYNEADASFSTAALQEFLEMANP
jgi:hemerythrin-like domain-containing protein